MNNEDFKLELTLVKKDVHGGKDTVLVNETEYFKGYESVEAKILVELIKNDWDKIESDLEQRRMGIVKIPLKEVNK
jgi:hypothetical protein